MIDISKGISFRHCDRLAGGGTARWRFSRSPSPLTPLPSSPPSPPHQPPPHPKRRKRGRRLKNKNKNKKKKKKRKETTTTTATSTKNKKQTIKIRESANRRKLVMTRPAHYISCGKRQNPLAADASPPTPPATPPPPPPPSPTPPAVRLRRRAASRSKQLVPIFYLSFGMSGTRRVRMISVAVIETRTITSWIFLTWIRSSNCSAVLTAWSQCWDLVRGQEKYAL